MVMLLLPRTHQLEEPAGEENQSWQIWGSPSMRLPWSGECHSHIVSLVCDISRCHSGNKDSTWATYARSKSGCLFLKFNCVFLLTPWFRQVQLFVRWGVVKWVQLLVCCLVVASVRHPLVLLIMVVFDILVVATVRHPLVLLIMVVFDSLWYYWSWWYLIS